MAANTPTGQSLGWELSLVLAIVGEHGLASDKHEYALPTDPMPDEVRCSPLVAEVPLVTLFPQ